MHLHMLVAELRGHGTGTALVRMSARTFIEALSLECLYSEPHAFNVAPNRTLQRAAFRYEMTHVTVPGDLNFEQVVNRWALPRGSTQ